jgi:antitoxin component YwqK of YwqJK toxin-antitoxin module
MMLCSTSSRLRSIPRALFVIPALSVLAFMFCSDSSNIYENLSFKELGEMFPTTYDDVELTIENELAVDENGDPFTGIKSTFDIESDHLTYKTQFLNGKATQYEFFEVDENGVARSTGLTKKFNNEDGNLVSRYYNYSAIDSFYLSSEIVEGDSTSNYSLYYENGKLLATWMLLLDRESLDVKRQGLFTEYDEEGNITKQERYENDELLETII